MEKRESWNRTLCICGADPENQTWRDLACLLHWGDLGLKLGEVPVASVLCPSGSWQIPRGVSVGHGIFLVGMPKLLMWKYLKQKSRKWRAFSHKCQCHKSRTVALLLSVIFHPKENRAALRCETHFLCPSPSPTAVF